MNEPTKPDKVVIYTLRCAHQKQAQLILLADQKAQILSVLVLVILTILGTRAYTNGFGRCFGQSEVLPSHPLNPFFIAEVIAIILGLLVVMPRITKAGTMDDISEMDNPLFFGAFANYDQEDYLEHVSDNIICNDSARRFLAKDIYQ